MINPSQDDIGRKVIYTGADKNETGVITSMNELYVFVRYEGEQTSKATLRRQLIWENPDIKKPAEAGF